ncbi:hypothetical protein V6N13_082793 [Hibiscus sabdariffa]|uniref:Poly polymerase n=1 Tax=Hibiscus sabdariffa TaxID=183260 RepID=A0ABR2BZX4_9ROSI
MGACFSSDGLDLISDSTHHPTAKVVSVSGDLHKYSLPVFVSQVLQAEAALSSSSSSSSSSSKIFLCNSDSLSYEEYIPALDVDDQLQANQIYFVLPVSKLQHRLVAALAVKASLAMGNDSKNDSNRRNKARISPVMVVAAADLPSSAAKSFAKPQPRQPGMSRSGSIRKLHRYTSRRAKLAVRSFKLRLSTIYEGSVL